MEATLEMYAQAKGICQMSPRTILPYHRMMYEAITKWVAGVLPDGKRNLAICIPPRHGKTLTAHDAIEWLIGMFPDTKWIYTSYTASLAEAQTMRIRDTLCSEWYRQIFPWVQIAPGNSRQDYVALVTGAEVRGVGMTGTITGFGAGLKREGFGGALVIDDPLSPDDARSATKRAHVNEWYTQTLKSRRNSSTTPILCIMQRIHQEDLIGHILKTEADQWEILSLPVMDEVTHEMLWPETFSREDAERMREVDPGTFYAQYQQDPMIPGGAMIKKDWWGWFDLDDRYRFDGLLFATADTAYKSKATADASVIRVWHATQQSLDCVDCVWGRWEFPELLHNAKTLYERWQERGLRRFYVEDKASGGPLEQTLRMQGIPAIAWKPQDFEFPDDKVSRVQESAWMIQGGRVRLPYGQEHSDVLVDEAQRFSPDMSHAHDDHVDAMTMAISVWRYAGGGR